MHKITERPLIMASNYIKAPQSTPNSFYYKFIFISLLSPWTITNMRIFTTLTSIFQTKYLYLKQSYLLLTWLYYLTFLNIYGKQATKLHSGPQCRFFVVPIRRQIFTLIKAPMAHKTYSKEQFTITFYKIHFGFTFELGLIPSTINYMLLLLLLTKTHFPHLATNLLFLKNFSFLTTYSDNYYFKYLL